MTSCWARYRYIPNTWSVPSAYASGIDDLYNIDENDLLEKYSPALYKAKKSVHQKPHLSTEELKKKFLTELTNYQDGHDLQGLWFVPGRR